MSDVTAQDTKALSQDELLLRLIRLLCAEDERYAELEIPTSLDERRNLLRALLNVRPPRPAAAQLIQLQDSYLQERLTERGVVDALQLPLLSQSIALWQGDITRLRVGAIVNAANEQMLGCFSPLHNCIDNCIHTYAGLQLRLECSRLMQKLRAKFGSQYVMPTAAPLLTPGYNLPASWIIHITGPIVLGALTPHYEAQLIECYRNILSLCSARRILSVAICCISTGVFHFPPQQAAQLAVATVQQYLREHQEMPLRVIFNVFSHEDYRRYAQLLES
ncbi:MAG: protein-ADP-ribose hydrolase [Succinivibrio sp.]|nr:protein-ADP-ribose hydrolase [Succinivibrio sp.]